MAYDYYVDDGGDGSQINGANGSWGTADTSINNADSVITFAAGDRVFFGHDHICQATNSADLSITGPSSAPSVLFISATQGSSPPTYAKSSTNQIDTTEGAYDITFAGSFALYGIRVAAGDDVLFGQDADSRIYAVDFTAALAANAQLQTGGSRLTEFINLTVDLTADGSSARTDAPVVFRGGKAVIQGLTFVNAGYRTGTVFAASTALAEVDISGADLSGFTNATACELIAPSSFLLCRLHNCLTAATWTAVSAQPTSQHEEILLTNVGPASAPTYLYHITLTGNTLSSTSIVRTGGATIESVGYSWLITTGSHAGEGSPYRTPWVYGYVGSTGSKTFEAYITNDTADFTDAEVWLEIEYAGTTGEAIWSYASDQRTITTTAVAQTDDTTSAWTGSGPSYSYKQKLSVTATVNVAGLYRARFCVGVASIASSRYFYVDPEITVS